MIVHFRRLLQKEMEERLTKLPDLGFEDNPLEKVKVSITTFAFDNSDLINKLKLRGEAII